MAEKIYLNSFSFKEKIFNDGGSVLNVSIHIDKAIAELESLRQYASDKGYVNTNINKRSQPSEYGHTHYMTMNPDGFKPSSEKASTPTASNPSQQSIPQTPSATIKNEDDDIPF